MGDSPVIAGAAGGRGAMDATVRADRKLFVSTRKAIRLRSLRFAVKGAHHLLQSSYITLTNVVSSVDQTSLF